MEGGGASCRTDEGEVWYFRGDLCQYKCVWAYMRLKMSGATRFQVKRRRVVRQPGGRRMSDSSGWKRCQGPQGIGYANRAGRIAPKELGASTAVEKSADSTSSCSIVFASMPP